MRRLPLRRFLATLTTSGLVLLSLAAPAIAEETAPAASPSPIASAEAPSEQATEPTTAVVASATPTPDASTSATNSETPSPAEPPQAAKVAPAGTVTDTTYTVGTDELCSPDGAFIATVGGAVTVDLDGLPDPGVNAVVFASDAAGACLTGLTSLTIKPRTTGTPVTSLEVGADTFSQSLGENSLTAVTFPGGLKTLTIGERAFRQATKEADQSNTLAVVSLPRGLTTLTVGADAFRQGASGDRSRNALTSIAFPPGLETLTIGEHAFRQDTWSANATNTLASVTFPAGLKTLSIARNAFFQGTDGVNSDNGLASIAFPDSLTSLVLGESAFAQETSDGSHTALASIDFPDALSSLTINEGAFRQSGGSGTSLAKVAFPAGLKTLTIGENAFAQESGVNTSLSTLAFSVGLETLTIGPAAFAQLAAAKTTLTSVTFPDGLTRLDIAETAFVQLSAQSVLASVSFPSSLTRLTVGSMSFLPMCDVVFTKSIGLHRLATSALSPAEAEYRICGPVQAIFRSTTRMNGAAALSIESDAFPSDSIWAWFGSDGTAFADAWNNPAANLPTTTLAGFRTLTFDLDGGALATTATGLHPATPLANTWFVYPDGSHASGPTVTTAGPLTSTDWPTTLPSASRSGNTFTGWCEAADCANPRAAGSRFALTDGAQTLSAVWTEDQALNPPVFTTGSTLSSGKAGQAYRLKVTFSGEAATSCAVASGTLPTGLALSDCVISGTPTDSGTFRFTIAATNADGTTTKSFRLTIAAGDATDDDLASTGADPAPLALTGSLLVALGAAASLARRRRGA
jgi:hypothetical protein